MNMHTRFLAFIFKRKLLAPSIAETCLSPKATQL